VQQNAEQKSHDSLSDAGALTCDVDVGERKNHVTVKMAAPAIGLLAMWIANTTHASANVTSPS
jgi:hypothetical protein